MLLTMLMFLLVIALKIPTNGNHRNVLTSQEGATARLLSLGTRLSPNERDNQVLG